MLVVISLHFSHLDKGGVIGAKFQHAVLLAALIKLEHQMPGSSVFGPCLQGKDYGCSHFTLCKLGAALAVLYWVEFEHFRFNGVIPTLLPSAGLEDFQILMLFCYCLFEVNTYSGNAGCFAEFTKSCRVIRHVCMPPTCGNNSLCATNFVCAQMHLTCIHLKCFHPYLFVCGPLRDSLISLLFISVILILLSCSSVCLFFSGFKFMEQVGCIVL